MLDLMLRKRFKFLPMILKLQVLVALIACSQPFNVLDVVVEVRPHILYCLLEVLRKISELFLEPLYDPLLVQFVFLLELSKLRLDDGDGLLDLIV